MANRIATLIRRSPLTQTEIARAAELGESHLARIKQRKNLKRTQYEVLERIAKALDVTVPELWAKPNGRSK